ncbi:MAG: hypothetical protein ABW123_22935 [Cystobacter sp.]
MRTKLCVLGAVLGAASLLPGACVGWEEAVPRMTGGQSGRGGTRLGQRPNERLDAVPPAFDGPTHPCELITVMQVPCDSATSTCEFTYWECPQNVMPLSA